MILLALGIAIFDEHARFTRLETNGASLLFAAIGTAVGRHFFSAK
jgi:hypothetical protein